MSVSSNGTDAGNTIGLEGTSVVKLSADGIIAIRGYYDKNQLTEQLGLTCPEILGELPSLAVGAVRETL